MTVYPQAQAAYAGEHFAREARDGAKLLRAERAAVDYKLPRCENGEPWELPGHGAAYDECGTFGIKGCPELAQGSGELHDVKKFMRTCGRAECPICYESWSALEAHRAMHRFEVAQQQLGVRALVRLIKHVIISPSLEDRELSTPKLRTKAYRVAKLAGFKGGLCIYHPFRLRCEACGLDDESCRCALMKGVWYWSPHFHLLGHGWIEGAETFEATGWLVRNLGLRKSLYRTIQYQLSHAGVWAGSGERILPVAKGKVLSITWFGQLSYSKLHVEDEDFTETCSTCGSKLVILDFDSNFDPPFEGMQITGADAIRLGLAVARWTGNGFQ